MSFNILENSQGLSLLIIPFLFMSWKFLFYVSQSFSFYLPFLSLNHAFIFSFFLSLSSSPLPNLLFTCLLSFYFHLFCFNLYKFYFILYKTGWLSYRLYFFIIFFKPSLVPLINLNNFIQRLYPIILKL